MKTGLKYPKIFSHYPYRFLRGGSEDNEKNDAYPPSKKDLQGHFQYHRSFWKIEGIFRIQTRLTIQEIKSNRKVYHFL